MKLKSSLLIAALALTGCGFKKTVHTDFNINSCTNLTMNVVMHSASKADHDSWYNKNRDTIKYIAYSECKSSIENTLIENIGTKYNFVREKEKYITPSKPSDIDISNVLSEVPEIINYAHAVGLKLATTSKVETIEISKKANEVF